MIITTDTPEHIRDEYYREEGKLLRMTVKQLYALARELKLNPYSGLTKDRLKRLILKSKGLI